jgi:hypothetical protein
MSSIAAASLVAIAAQASSPASPASESEQDAHVAIPAGAEGADLGEFTVEGEDRIRIEFERPTLRLTLDPRSVGGLDWSDPDEILERTSLDTTTPFLRAGTTSLSRLPTRPWVRTLALGDVVRLTPKLKDVETWHLSISDAAGRVVTKFGGDGEPPSNIGWDGMTLSGFPAWPGHTYVHAIDVEDPAGNRRRFNGSGFVMPAFALARDDSIHLVVPGQGKTRALESATILELADWINQHATLDTEVRIEALARTYSDAEAMARSTGDALAKLTAGNPARLRTISRVDPSAPVRGVLRVMFRTGSTPPVAPKRRR